jgi:hypothetical protein
VTKRMEQVLEFIVKRDGAARGRGQHRTFAALERLGLVSYAGVGVDEDDHSKDVRLYDPTEAGRAYIRERDAAPPPGEVKP